MVDVKVRARKPLPSSLTALKAAVVEEWNTITLEEVRGVLTDMPKHVQDVINVNSGYTNW
jgi:hypothetical protein